MAKIRQCDHKIVTNLEDANMPLAGATRADGRTGACRIAERNTAQASCGRHVMRRCASCGGVRVDRLPLSGRFHVSLLICSRFVPVFTVCSRFVHGLFARRGGGKMAPSRYVIYWLHQNFQNFHHSRIHPYVPVCSIGTGGRGAPSSPYVYKTHHIYMIYITRIVTQTA